jgi:hypothetical protein
VLLGVVDAPLNVLRLLVVVKAELPVEFDADENRCI